MDNRDSATPTPSNPYTVPSVGESEPPKLVRKSADLPELDDATPQWASSQEGTSELETTNSSQPPPGWVITEPTEFSTLPSSNLFQQNETMIEDSIVERPLIAPLAPMAVLRAEYENGNPNFLKQIDWLVERGYQGIRRTRGDGDCFYRSLAFAYVERIMNAPEPELSVMRAISMLETTPAKLSSVGFQELVFEDFYDMFRSLIMRIIQPEPGASKLNARGLFDAFNDPETSNSIVMYLRLLTSAQIRLDPENYAPFLFHPELGEPMETVAFCENFVEAVGKEADHPQITALSRALNVSISVAYLDGHDRNSSDPVNFVPFDTGDDDSEEPIRLLYRPGHYDILDSRSEEPLT